MPEHQNRYTESVTRWCNHCNRPTQHAVSGHRVGHCTEHAAPQFTKAQLQRQKRREREIQNPPLFQ